MHNESSAKVTQRIRSTDEGKRIHNKRSAEGMQKARKTIEGKRKNKENGLYRNETVAQKQ